MFSNWFIRDWFKVASLLGNAVFGMLILAVSCDLARGELTVENLVGTAIAGVGPFYQDVDDAIKEFAKNDFAKALEHLASAKKSTPRLAPAEVMMARLYWDNGQPGPGITMLEKAIQKMPQDPEALVLLGERAAAEGRITEAGLLFEKAAKLLDKFNENPRRKQNLQVRTYTTWAGVEEKSENWSEAQKRLDELLKIEPRSGLGHESLGRVLFRLGKQKEAYAEFQAAAEYDKTILPAELAMATLAADKPKAEQWLKLAIQKSGQDLRTRLGVTQFQLRNNNVDEAKIHAEEAIKMDPTGLDSNTWMGIISRMLGDYKKAEKHLSLAHLLAPTNSAIIDHLALSLIELPDKVSQQRALQFAELNVQQYPNNHDLLPTLGWVNYKLNRRAEASRAFTAVINSPSGVASRSPAMAYYLATVAKERGRNADAVQYLTEALNHNEPFPYRKPAQELLAQLSKLEKSNAKSAKRQSGATKSEVKAEDSVSKTDADSTK